MSKKLINDPSFCVDEFLQGLTSIHSGLIKLPGHRVILRKDLKNVRGKVAILSGGGAGHEPAHAGFVGKGMLSGAISGAVFASPPPSSIFAAIRAVHKFDPSGVLLIVKNYTGDRLNFGLASEWALNLGIKIEMVVIGEDCALTSADRSAGRRGLAGTVFAHKIGGALAEKGETLENIVSILNKVSTNLGTIGVGLYPCILPGTATPSFELEDSEYELGLGIHGEAGIKRHKLGSCQDIVAAMIDHLTDPKSSTHLSLYPKESVVVLLNNLGGTSNLEMGIFAKDVLDNLHQRNVNVLRAYSGHYMTSLQMAGVSLTILKLRPGTTDLLPLLDWKTDVAAPLVSVRCDPESSVPQLEEFREHISSPPLQDSSLLSESQANVLKICVFAACEALQEQEELLNEYDRGAGDGDCGTTHARGARAIIKHLEDSSFENIGQVFQQIGTVCGEEMGGSSGAMYSIFMTAVARHISRSSSVTLLDFAKALKRGLDSVQKYGGARVGDRTMIDVLNPIVEKMLTEKEAKTCCLILPEIANQSAEETRNMRAKAGRASYVNISQLVHPDAGAKAVSIIVNASCQAFNKNN